MITLKMGTLLIGKTPGYGQTDRYWYNVCAFDVLADKTGTIRVSVEVENLDLGGRWVFTPGDIASLFDVQ